MIFGDGTQTRDFTYVANVVAANLAALEDPRPLEGAVYNVGTGRRISLLDLVKTMNAIFGTNLRPNSSPPALATSVIPRPASTTSTTGLTISQSSTSRKACASTCNPFRRAPAA